MSDPRHLRLIRQAEAFLLRAHESAVRGGHRTDCLRVALEATRGAAVHAEWGDGVVGATHDPVLLTDQEVADRLARLRFDPPFDAAQLSFRNSPSTGCVLVTVETHFDHIDSWTREKLTDQIDDALSGTAIVRFERKGKAPW